MLDFACFSLALITFCVVQLSQMPDIINEDLTVSSNIEMLKDWTLIWDVVHDQKRRKTECAHNVFKALKLIRRDILKSGSSARDKKQTNQQLSSHALNHYANGHASDLENA